MTNQLTVNELELFDETIEAVKKLKLFNHTTAEWAGSDFSINVDTGLLNPAFYIYEIYGGDTLVEAIAFDRATQTFYIRETGDTLTHDELIQHVNRGLIQWASSSVTAQHIDEDKESIAKFARSSTDIRAINNPDLTRLNSEILELKKSALLNKLDFSIAAYYGGVEAAKAHESEYLARAARIHQSILDKFEEMQKIGKESNGGIMRKIMRLLTK